MASEEFQNLLTQPIAFHRIFSKIAGSVTAGVMLSQAFYWSKTKTDGWFYKTQSDWTEETTLTRTEQETARRKLVAVGVLEEKKMGMPAKLFFRVNYTVLERLSLQYAENLQTGVQETCKQVCNIPANKSAENLQTFKGTENTAENTAEKKTIKTIVSDKPKQIDSPELVSFRKTLSTFQNAYAKPTTKGAAIAQNNSIKKLFELARGDALVCIERHRFYQSQQWRNGRVDWNLVVKEFNFYGKQEAISNQNGTGFSGKETDQQRRQREATERNATFRELDQILAERDKFLQSQNESHFAESSEPIELGQI